MEQQKVDYLTQKLGVLESSEILTRLNDYTIVPNSFARKRLDYFYGPYNGFYNMRKYMDFNDDGQIKSPTENWQKIKSAIMHKDKKLVEFFEETVSKMLKPQTLAEEKPKIKKKVFGKHHQKLHQVELQITSFGEQSPLLSPQTDQMIAQPKLNAVTSMPELKTRPKTSEKQIMQQKSFASGRQKKSSHQTLNEVQIKNSEVLFQPQSKLVQSRGPVPPLAASLQLKQRQFIELRRDCRFQSSNQFFASSSSPKNQLKIETSPRICQESESSPRHVVRVLDSQPQHRFLKTSSLLQRLRSEKKLEEIKCAYETANLLQQNGIKHNEGASALQQNLQQRRIIKTAKGIKTPKSITTYKGMEWSHSHAELSKLAFTSPRLFEI